MPEKPPSKLDNQSAKPTFNKVAAPTPSKKPDEPKPAPKPPQSQGPTPPGPGAPPAQVSPQIRDQKDDQAKKEEFKKKMLVKQEFNKKARDHSQDRDR